MKIPRILEFDLIVIGSGGGSKIARPAAMKGHRVALIESGAMGGTCLNHGCIPSKMLLHPADIVDEIHQAHKFSILGVDSSRLSVDREALVKRVSEDIDSESAMIAKNATNVSNLTVFRHKATFNDTHSILLDDPDTTLLKAARIIVAAGCRASVPDIPGLDGTPYMTYKEALRDTSSPKSLIVIGGGYIATELGYYYGMTGSRVTFFVRSRILSQEDDEIQQRFEKEFCQRFPVHLGQIPIRIAYDTNTKQFTAYHGDGSRTTADALLVATGVTPNTDFLQVHRAGLETDSKGFLVVNDQLQTSKDSIYAFGDIIGRNLFRHTANFEGEWLFQHLFERHSRPLSSDLERLVYPPIPHAVFSNPQIGSVGLTEKQAVTQYPADIVIGRAEYSDVAMGNAMMTEGLVKLVFVKSTRKLIGAHIIGKEASNLVHTCMAFMAMGGRVDDMKKMIYIHPALPEVIRDASRDGYSKFNS